MVKNLGEATTREMTLDVSTRPAAKVWLQRRIRKLMLLLLLGVVLAPVASGIVVGVRYFRRVGDLPPIVPLVTASLLWAAIIVALMLLVVGIISVKYLKFAKRVRPILESGQEAAGEVAEIAFSARKKGGVTLHKETLTLQLSTGDTVRVAIEETEGTPLPKVAVGAPGVVWTLGGQVVVGTSGALFESMSV